MKYDLICLICNKSTEVDIIEYGTTNVICTKCKKEQVVQYSEDSTEDYSECWDSYWVEEKFY